MTLQNFSAAALLATFFTFPAQAADIELFDGGFNIDGTTYCPIGCDVSNTDMPDGFLDPEDLPSFIQTGSFDFATGLGTVSIRIEGAGNHNVITFLDHDIDIDKAGNSFFNESGAVIGIPDTGQSWEIDEPGFLFGDIFGNFLNATLDNTNSVPAGSEDDVSMALGWDFTLTADQFAQLTFQTATTAPASDFYLVQTDPDSPDEPNDIYFSSSLSIQQIPPIGVSAPGTLGLLGVGLIFCRTRTRQDTPLRNGPSPAADRLR